MLKRIGGLDALHVPGHPDGPTVVLFHGYGASADDLFPLNEVIRAPEGTNWYFPNGPLEVPIGPGWTGRAWFQLDIMELQRLVQSNGDFTDWSRLAPNGAEEVRPQVESFFKELNVPKNKLVLGGFSQGAMLATGTTLDFDESPAGLVVLSGSLVNSDVWLDRMPLHKGLKYFQSHGQYDPVLPFALAEKLNQAFEKNGWQGTFVPFPGQHEIPPQVVSGLSEFITRVLV